MEDTELQGSALHSFVAEVRAKSPETDRKAPCNSFARSQTVGRTRPREERPASAQLR